MKAQDSNTLSASNARPPNGRRAPEKGLGFGTALLGIICAVGVLAILALLFHAG